MKRLVRCVVLLLALTSSGCVAHMSRAQADLRAEADCSQMERMGYFDHGHHEACVMRRSDQLFSDGAEAEREARERAFHLFDGMKRPTAQPVRCSALTVDEGITHVYCQP